MKQKLRNTLYIILSLLLISSTASPAFADGDADFKSRPEYYAELCSGVLTAETHAVCTDYRAYVIKNIASSTSEIDEIEANRAKIDSDLKSNLGLMHEYQNKIKAFETQIATLEKQIVGKEAEIKQIEQQMQERLEKISKLEKDVKAYMVYSQSTMRVNGYIEFIMGANDFSDIVRRIEGLNAIKRQNQEVVERLRVERAKLQEEQASIENQKFEIEQNHAKIQADRSAAKQYEAEIQYIHQKLGEQKEVLEIANARAVEKLTVDDNLASQLENLLGQDIQKPKPEPETGGTGGNGGNETGNGGGNESGNGSGNGGGESGNGGGTIPNGDSSPAPGLSITESVWEYSWGQVHLGTDLGADMGTPILAMGRGLVVVADGGCNPSSSYSCNGGLGNHMSTIFQRSDGKIYGSLIMHMSGFNAAPMTVVSPGQQVGTSGNSGASTGPHIHVEVFYLGNDSVMAAFNRWNATSSTRTAQFGLGGSSGALSSLCSNKGWTPPCRVNPEPFV